MSKILVIEDDLALSAGLCFELDASGYITVAAYNCRKAPVSWRRIISILRSWM